MNFMSDFDIEAEIGTYPLDFAEDMIGYIDTDLLKVKDQKTREMFLHRRELCQKRIDELRLTDIN
jgi:hypothetical protein